MNGIYFFMDAKLIAPLVKRATLKSDVINNVYGLLLIISIGKVIRKTGKYFGKRAISV